jgi:DNA polymerase-3 subunit alpha
VLDQIAAEVTRETYGTIVYQEQIMAMLRRMGFDWSEADKWVKSLKDNTKTLALAVDEAQGKPVFRKFAQKLVDEYGASWDDAWAFTLKFTQYAFNKAHAVGYALTAYLQMWFRVHYPLEFWSATLDMEAFEPRRRAYMVSAARDGVIFLPPHVNGTANFSVEDNAIRIGTQSVKNVGSKASVAIELSRPYAGRSDLESRVPRRTCNSKVLAALEAAGALEFDQDVLQARAINLNQRLREERINLAVYSRAGVEGGA